MRRLLPVLVALAFAAIPALGETADRVEGAEGERIVVLRDGPDDGRLAVGNLAHFGFALVDAHGAPIRHHDATFRLVQNGVVLFETAASHEYDGIFALAHTFTVPGPYEVRVESDTGARHVVNGTVVAPTAVLAPSVAIDFPATVPALVPVPIKVRVVDALDSIVPHSDALLEIRRADSGLLVHRGHLHTHREAMEMALAFAVPGEYEARVVAYLAFPNGAGPDLANAVGAARFVVGAPGPAAPAVLAPAIPALASPAVGARPDEGHAPGGLVLSLGADPDVRNGPLNHQRLTALVWDEEETRAAAHVNFAAEVVGPSGVVFSSGSLHEYDGALEVLLAQLPPGSYAFRVEASRGEWKDAKELAFTILPPAVPVVGPLDVVVEGLDDLRAGVPAELTFKLVTPAGVVVPHSEIDFSILPAKDAAPLLATKVHTHMEAPKATVTFPRAGSYVLVADGDTLQPSPSLYAGARPGGSVVLELSVAEGPGLPVDDALEAAEEQAPLPVPAPGLLAAVAVAAVAVALARRR